MYRAHLRTEAGWRRFDFWALVFLVLIAVLLIVLWLATVKENQGYCCDRALGQDAMDEVKPQVVTPVESDPAPTIIAPPVPSEPYFVSLKRGGDRVMLSGKVGDDATRNRLIALAGESFGLSNVRSSLAVDKNVKGFSLPFVDTLWPQLGGVSNMLFTVNSNRMFLSGDIADKSDFDSLNTHLSQFSHKQITLANEIALKESIVEPSSPLEDIDCTEVLAASHIEFDFASAVLKQSGKRTLQNTLFCLSTGRYQVIGHTDNVGDDVANQVLSQARAQSVVNYLVGLGIDAKRLSAEGRGERSPIAPNETDQGRAKNRRIEFVIRP